MSIPSNQPRPAGRSTKRLVGMVALGLGLIALTVGYLVVQGDRIGFWNNDERPEPTATTSEAETASAGSNAEADFADATCEEFDFAEFEAISTDAAELATAYSDASPGRETGTLYCEYTSLSGMTLSLTATADTAEDFAERTTDRSRLIWEGAPDIYTIEDFDNGDLTGYTNSHVTESHQVFLLNAGAGRLLIMVGLTAEPGGFEPAEALGIADTIVGQALERFETYI